MSIDLVVGAYQHAEWRDAHAPDHHSYGRGMNRYVLWFGACAPTRVLVYAYSLEEALEEAAGGILDAGWVGLFTEPDYHDAFEDLQRNPERTVKYPDKTPCVFPQVDGTYGDYCTQHNSIRSGMYPCYACDASIKEEPIIPASVAFATLDAEQQNLVHEYAETDLTYTESGYIASWEWGIEVENPTREQLLELAHSECYTWHGAMEHKHPMASRKVLPASCVPA